jgi:hypothetical protein
MLAILAGVVASIGVIIGLAHVAKRPGRAERRHQQTYQEFERFTNQLCECTTVECSEVVMKEITTWSTELAKTARGDDPQPSPELTARFTELARRLTDCAQKLYAQRAVEPTRYEAQEGGLER